jgi:TPR repeat protein
MRRDIRLTPYDEEFERTFDEREFDAGDADSDIYGAPSSKTIGHYAPADNRMPIFLAGEDEPPRRRGFGSGRDIQYRPSIWPRILKIGSLTAAAAGIALAIASMDNPLALFSNAKASLPGASADQPAAAPAAAAPAPKTQSAARVQVSPPAASTKLTRDEIAAALRGAQQQAQQQGAAQPVQAEIPQPRAAAVPQQRVAAIPQTAEIPQPRTAEIPQPRAAEPPQPNPAAPPALRLDADELANLMKRARALIQVGDISPARLLLERAAEAQEVSAALLLAQTYDPAVLGNQDQRSITADPAMAKLWYQKAAQLGSPEALGRLAQIQN